MAYIEEGLYKQLGLLLRTARESAGLTLTDIANRVKVTPMTIQRYEKGERKISVEKIKLLCSYYSTDSDLLMMTAINNSQSTPVQFEPNRQLSSEIDDADLSVTAILKVLQSSSSDIRLRLFDLISDYLLCDDFEQGKISTMANILALEHRESKPTDIDSDIIDLEDDYESYIISPPKYRGEHEELVERIAQADREATIEKLKRQVKESNKKEVPGDICK